MKLSIKKKKKKERSSDRDDRSSSRMGGTDWMITGRENLKKEQQTSEALSKSGNRPPEMWIPDGESRIVRFRSSEPIGIYQYSIRVGKNWRSVTRPAPGTKDLFKLAAMTPQLKYVYEVIDVKGYKDKKTGKRMKNQPRFFKANGRFEKMIEKMREKYGGLTKRNFEISRTGQSKDTTYMIIAEDKEPMTEEMKKAPKLMPDFAKYYAPPTLAEQKVLLAGVVDEEDEDEEDDDEDEEDDD